MQLITTKKGCETKKIKLKKGDTFVEVVIECDEDSIKEIIKEQTSRCFFVSRRWRLGSSGKAIRL